MKFITPPPELSRECSVKLYGHRRAHVFNHKGLTDFSEQAVCVNAGDYVIKITGEHLALAGMTDSEIVVDGLVRAVVTEG